MGKPETSSQLKQLILLKEAELATDQRLIKEHFQQTCNGLKPVNLITGLLKSMNASPDLKAEAIKTAIGLISKFAAKKLFPKKETSETESSSNAMEKAIAKAVDNNSDKKDPIIRQLLKKLLYQYIISK